jgi:hypothetical protein
VCCGVLHNLVVNDGRLFGFYVERYFSQSLLIMLLFDNDQQKTMMEQEYCHLFYSSGNRKVYWLTKTHKTFILLYETKTSIRTPKQH